MDWANSNAAAIQAFASAATVIVTLVLAAATFWYVHLTRESLKLSRDQFQRQWQPDLSISFEHVPPHTGRLTVHNIGNCSVTVTEALVGVVDAPDSGPIPYVVHRAVDAHSREHIDIENFLVDALSKTPPSPKNPSERGARVRLGIYYIAMGTIGTVGYVEYAVRLSSGWLVEAIPINVRPTL